MKLVFLMYLEDDESLVERLLHDAGIGSYSRLPLEGHSSGIPGWFGEVPAYRSSLVFAVLPADRAERLMDAVASSNGVQDATHPIHAMQVDVEKAVASGAHPSSAGGPPSGRRGAGR